MADAARKQLSILFSDVVDCLDLKSRVGADAYERILDRHNEIFESLIRQFPGPHVIKHTGDGYLATFVRGEEAVRFAMAFARAIAREPFDPPLEIRIGMNCGEASAVTMAGRPDVVGAAVDLAARISNLAEAKQILATRAIRDLAKDACKWLSHGKFVVKGLREHVEVFEACVDGLAPMCAPEGNEDVHALHAPPPRRVEISAKDGRTWQVSLQRRRLIVGRAPEAGVRLADDTVSRRHAELFKDPQGRWHIQDLGSRNGIKVNRQRVPEHVLEDDYPVRVGNFSLKLLPMTLDESQMREATREQTLTTLDEDRVAEVGSGHLQKLAELARAMDKTKSPADRAAALCAAFVSPALKARLAMLIRVPIDASAPLVPRVLASAVSPACKSIHVSRTLLKKARESRAPVLATNFTSAVADSELSIEADEAPEAAIACPLKQADGWIEIFYLQLPPHYGSREWLALASLAASKLAG